MKRLTIICLLSLSSFFQLRASDGDSIWANNFIHDLYFTFSQTPYWDTLLANHTAGVYTRVDMVFDGRSLPSCGIQFKGNSSFNNASNKKSFKVDMNEYVSGQDYDGIKKFNLNNGFKDPSMLREKLALDFMNAHNITAPRCNFARVYLNGTYWGLYTIVEDINSKFLKQHYPDNDGNLFKGDPTGDLRWYGATESSYYSHYELQTNETQNDWSDLVHMADMINNTSTSVFYDSLETVLDTWSFLNYMAATNMFANLDSYIGSGHNYYIYDDSTYFRFRWIAWDVNESFGNFMMSFNTSTIQTMNYDFVSSSTSRPLATKMLADPTYRSMYLTCFCNLMPYFNNTAMDGTIDSLANVIRSSVYSDNLKTYTNQQFEDNLTMAVNGTPGLKSFISARAASLTSQLSFTGCWLGTNEIANSTALSLFPNPAQNSTTLILPAGTTATVEQLKIVDVNGKEVQNSSVTQSTATSFVISTAEMANGIYFILLNTDENATLTSKLVIMH
jgi:spore coat protein CotH